jgi:hypothetical protein
MTTVVLNYAQILQFPSGFRNTLAANIQHVGSELLGKATSK